MIFSCKSHLKSDTRMYTVVSVYYKHGQCKVETYASDEEMRAACYDEYEGFTNCRPLAEFKAVWDEQPLDKLIQQMIRYGNWFLENQNGWGWQYVIQGEALTVMGDQEEYERDTPPAPDSPADFDGMTCEVCDEDKPATVKMPDFARRSRTRERVELVCEECVAEWERKHPELEN